jgi:hypothetical protein
MTFLSAHNCIVKLDRRVGEYASGTEQNRKKKLKSVHVGRTTERGRKKLEKRKDETNLSVVETYIRIHVICIS